MLNGLPQCWIKWQADTGRRALVEVYFARGGVANRRVEATIPVSLPTVRVQQPFTNSMPELAIMTSHLDAIGMAYQTGSELAVIMEDDVRSRYVFDLTSAHAFGKLVADHLLYRRSDCYTASVPYILNDVALTSTHAPHRDATYPRPGALGAESVMQRIESRTMAADETTARPTQNRYPFALRAL